MKKIDTLLFDLDGTLVDSNELILETFRQTLKTFLPERTFSHPELLEMVGPPLSETFRIISTDEKIVQAAIDTYRRIYVELEFDHISLYDHVLETLRYFKSKGFGLGVVTTKFKESAMPSLDRFGIAPLLDVLVCLDDVKNHKPHPEPILTALRAIAHQEVLMVGDNVSDILAGQNAGVLTCAVSWSPKREELSRTQPTFWIGDFLELVDIIDTYNKEVS